MDRCLLNILRHGLTGVPLTRMEALTREQWHALAELAQQHKLLPLLYQTAHSLPDAAEALAPFGPEVRRQVMRQTQKTHAFLTLNRRLRQAGIEALVVKGIVCRSLYPEPDLRPSADEDLWVMPEQYEKAQALLEQAGMTCAKIRQDDYERDYRSPDSPLFVELHRSLFQPGEKAYGGWNRYFDGAFSRAEPVTVSGEAVLTMEPTDHLLYLLLHAFKHFLHSGVGIRQVCDITLFANTWGSRVDWTRVRGVCDTVRATGFAAAVLRIGEEWLGLDRAAACCPEFGPAADTGPLLEDILRAGVYGTAQESRVHSSSMTLDAVTADRDGGRKGILGTLFPAPQRLELRYPYLKRHPYLAPVAWADRLVRYAAGSGKDAARSAAIGRQRVDLLRRYGVIDPGE